MLIGAALAAAAVAAPSGEALVSAAARKLLLEQAERAGWREPQVQAEARAATASRPPACAAPEVRALDTRMPSRMRFELSCPGTDAPGQVFVVRARLSAELPVAALPLASGHVLAADDVVFERREVTPGAELFAEADEAIGRIAQRSLAAGQPLGPRVLVEPLLVRRGDSVQIRARRESVEVVVPGQALDAGRRGQTIRVRNTANGSVIRARVVETGQVEPESMSSSSR